MVHGRRECDEPPKHLKPHVATVNLTENCQSRCRMCDYWRTSNPSPITQERAETLVEELRQLGVGTLRFLGGEPLLRRDLFAVLEHAAPLGFERIILATNGLLLDRFAGEVNRSCITNLTVSIDDLADTNNAIRGVPGYFDRVLRNLTLIQDKRIKLATLLTNQLASDIHGLIQICKSRNYLLDVNLPSFDLPYASSSAAREGIHALWPTEKDVERVLQALVEAGYLPHRSLTAAGSTCFIGAIQCVIVCTDSSRFSFAPTAISRSDATRRNRSGMSSNGLYPESSKRPSPAPRPNQCSASNASAAFAAGPYPTFSPTRCPTSATPSAGWTRAPRRRDCPDGLFPILAPQIPPLRPPLCRRAPLRNGPPRTRVAGTGSMGPGARVARRRRRLPLTFGRLPAACSAHSELWMSIRAGSTASRADDGAGCTPASGALMQDPDSVYDSQARQLTVRIPRSN